MSPHRKVIIHYHLFKNAGTSIERSLNHMFGQGLYQLESDSPSGTLSAADAEQFIARTPDLKALTSHQLRPPLPTGDFSIFPVLLLREPLTRARSAYLFEWQKQPGLARPKGPFSEYVRHHMEHPGINVIANYQVAHLARDLPGSNTSNLTAAVELAMTFLDQLPAFGLVERFADSITLINRHLGAFMEDRSIELDVRHDNASQPRGMSIAQQHGLIRQELGDELMNELISRNHFDLMLYSRAQSLFESKLAANQQPPADASADPKIGAEPAPSSEQRSARTVDLDLERLARRVRLQDKLLAEIGQNRQVDDDRYQHSQNELRRVQKELNALRSSSSSATTTPTSSVRRGLGLLQRARRTVRGQSEQHSLVQGLEIELDPNIQMVAESGMFDAVSYVEQNPEVEDSGMSPLEHFVSQGGAEGKAPSELFDSSWYLEHNPDVRNAGVNPLLHYLLHGREEGRPARSVDGSLLTDDQSKIRAGVPEPEDYESICQNLTFDHHVDVDASIVIPVFNQIGHTIACLESLGRLQTAYSFEVIVMDDCSTDDEVTLLSQIEGLRVIRNDENLGFLKTCNRSADQARGRYLVLLNNDTMVDRGWLDALLDTFTSHANVGVVGSKLIYPNGVLQEAGGIIYQDGRGSNYGKNKSSDDPRYNYVRDVDYCSAASIAVELDYFDKLGRFDERYEPAYYEDTDFCFKARQDGRRVLYQPSSEVVHFEGVSSGTDVTRGVKRHQTSNRDKFVAKWQEVLSNDHFASGLAEHLAADRHHRGHLLIIDANVPTPDRDSGSLDMCNLVRILSDFGYRVHFMPAHGFYDTDADVSILQQLGALVVRAPHFSSVKNYLEANKDLFETVILSRVTVAKDIITEVLTNCPSARTIFYTVDLHFLRLQREAELSNDRSLQQQADALERAELQLMNMVDSTVVLSGHERDLLESRGKRAIHVIPLIRQLPDVPDTPFEDRDGVVFIGGFAHPPNVDAVEWLLDEIWPAVRGRCARTGRPPVPLRIVGGGMPKFLRRPAPDVEIYGFVESIEPLFSKSLLSIAPLRWGAGLKGKVATSLGWGVPVLATPTAMEGTDRTDGILEIGFNPNDIANSIVSMCSSPSDWRHRSKAARRFAEDTYSIAAVAPLVADLLDIEPNPSPLHPASRQQAADLTK